MPVRLAISAMPRETLNAPVLLSVLLSPPVPSLLLMIVDGRK